MTPFTFNTTPSIRFGAGLIKDLGTDMPNILGTRIFLVTDPGMVATGLVGKVQDILSDTDIELAIFDTVQADPPETIILDCAKAARDHSATGILGFGGGSSMDVAKLTAVLAFGQETLSDIYGVGNITGTRLPLMLIPTTAGTGSEVTPISIVTTGTSEKMGVVSPVLLPDAILLDPELTLGLPAPITAATGIDAMVHAIEAYASTSANNNPLSKMLAVKALQLMGASLERAVHHGDDLTARSDMLLGSMLAGQAFANSPVAAVHALAYPIGGHFHIPHGLSNALVLPHVLRFNAEVAPTPYAELAPHAFPDLDGLNAHDAAIAFPDALAKLSRRCGLPQRLRDVDIPEDALEMMARDAMNQTRLLVNNPREVTQNDAYAIYKAAW